MVRNSELLRYSIELIRMAVDKEALHKKLITQTADLQDFESNLFKLCVLDFAEDVQFLKERSFLIDKVKDDFYCDGVYSVISNGVITFFDYGDNPLLRLVLNNKYADEEVYNF